MLETCLRGEEKTNLFACIFLQRLPREIRVLLARVDHKDTKELARQADEFRALHDNTMGSAITAIQQDCAEGDFVAAVRAGDRQRGGSGSRGHGRGHWGSRGRGGRGNGHSSSSAEEPEASKEARLAAGLCIKHWRNGELASSCTTPYIWRGNGGAWGN
jgi:hypothetical protein